MSMPVRSSRGKAAAFFLSVLWGAGSGCGVVYTPQEFAISSFTYGYKGDFEAVVEVVPLTFTSARAANADGYVPKALPSIFLPSELPSDGSVPSIRSRLAAEGLDQVQPALVLEPPVPVVPYDGVTGVLPPVLRNEAYQPVPASEPAYIPLPDAPVYEQDGVITAPVSSYVPRGAARPSMPVAALPSPDMVLAASGGRTLSFSSEIDLGPLLERPQVRQRPANNPLPDIDPGPYRIGPGDEIGLQFRSSVGIVNAEGEGDLRPGLMTQRLIVQSDGRIFIPQGGSVDVGGMTLGDARRAINDQLVASGLGFDPGVEIVEFGSQSIAVDGLDNAELIPITIRPTTLGEAVVAVGGLGPNPANTIVRVLRTGRIYEMGGDTLLGPRQLSKRILVDGDIVSVKPGYNPEEALNYFDQQIRLREVEQAANENALVQAREAREVARENREAAREGRDVESASRERLRLDLELQAFRLEADRLRREFQNERLQAQRETALLNEEARVSNAEARQAYLDQLRELEVLNRQDAQQIRQETRETLIANQEERIRVNTARRDLLRLELEEERLQREYLSESRQQARALFNERMELGAIQQDYVTVAGETVAQTTVALPFDGQMTLNRVIYGGGSGIDPRFGDTSEIYVIRTPPQDRIDDKVIAYHLNASNPAALAVASIFQLRPNDVVYVNPQPITKWNRVLSQILPSTGLLQSGVSALSQVN